MVIDLTTTATEELKKVIETKESKKPLRIYIASYG
jgi:Fe-S cluster assembly iron-binding protein IscA